MKAIVLLACLVVLASARTLTKNAQFEAFKKRFGKTYKSAIEEDFRLKIFLNNLKAIEAHNKLHKAGKVTFTLGVNQFADLTTKEFAEAYNGLRKPATIKPKTAAKSVPVKAVPDSIDWRSYGYVTPVKDQGQCGGCWSFSAVASTEGQHFASTGNLVSLSEQNLLDCSWNYGNEGCNGGWMDQAFQYIIDNNGIDTEASYPYEERDGTCRYSVANRGATISSYKDVASGDENALKQACGSIGPISVAIDASHASFQLYNGGVYYEALCMENVLDHGVTVVGYGAESGEDYWLVKNSWGTSWGEAGYIKMSRNRNNNCGIATEASYPIV